MNIQKKNYNVRDKIVPIFSGGIDSTTMLWFLTNNSYEITEIISFDYSQKHRIEIERAKLIIEKYNEIFESIPHHIVDIRNIGKLIAYGAITGDYEIPKSLEDVTSQRITIVPNRNMIFLSIAAGRAITIGTDNIGFAAHASDYSVYPDCRPEFISSMNKTLLLGNLWDPVHLVAPFKHLSKAEIIKLAIEIGVPLELTWSCYSNKERPCLECGTCLERTEAFVLNNISDPALTHNEWSNAVKIFNQKKKLKFKNKFPFSKI